MFKPPYNLPPLKPGYKDEDFAGNDHLLHLGSFAAAKGRSVKWRVEALPHTCKSVDM